MQWKESKLIGIKRKRPVLLRGAQIKETWIDRIPYIVLEGHGSLGSLFYYLGYQTSFLQTLVYLSLIGIGQLHFVSVERKPMNFFPLKKKKIIVKIV